MRRFPEHWFWRWGTREHGQPAGNGADGMVIMNIHIQRFPHQPTKATMGGLQTYNGLILHTLENMT